MRWEEEVVQTLQERAARHGRSAEAVHREALRETLLQVPAEDPKKVLLEMSDFGEDEDFGRIRNLPRPFVT